MKFSTMFVTATAATLAVAAPDPNLQERQSISSLIDAIQSTSDTIQSLWDNLVNDAIDTEPFAGAAAEAIYSYTLSANEGMETFQYYLVAMLDTLYES